MYSNSAFHVFGTGHASIDASMHDTSTYTIAVLARLRLARTKQGHIPYICTAVQSYEGQHLRLGPMSHADATDDAVVVDGYEAEMQMPVVSRGTDPSIMVATNFLTYLSWPSIISPG